MPALDLGEFEISPRESDEFARLSGDYNPLHLDPVKARRYQFGSTLIHGINGSMRALDILLGSMDLDPGQHKSLASIRIQYSKPIRQQDLVQLTCSDGSSRKQRLEVRNGGKRAQLIDLEWSDAEPEPGVMPESSRQNEITPTPREISISDAATLDESFPLPWHRKTAEALFPNLSRILPHAQLAVLLGSTNIVGMRCPGLHSLYGALALDFKNRPGKDESKLHYRVTESDRRFSRVVIALEHSSATGQIECFFRPRPVEQASYSQVRAMVEKNQFADQKALVIGGSRGLGEVIAKTLCAGGAEVLITYAKGRIDAENLVREIVVKRGKCKATHYDVLSDVQQTISLNGDTRFTHIYYLASPTIEKLDTLWNCTIFDRYCRFYIGGLATLIEKHLQLQGYRDEALHLFMPSTIFVGNPEKGFSEYIAAKSAAESFCAQLPKRYPKWSVHAPRLPRLLTDQTNSVVNDAPIDTVKTILYYLAGAKKDHD